MFENNSSTNRCFSIALILFAVLIFIGFGSVNKSQAVDLQQKSKEEISSRNKLPRIISSLEANNLSKNEYISLGELKLEQKVEECWENGRGCQAIPHPKGPTDTLLEQAKGKGADLVVLSADGETTTQKITKAGKCLQSERSCTVIQNPGQISCAIWEDCYMKSESEENQCQDKCVSSETIHGTRTYKTSRIKLWRYEPTVIQNSTDETVKYQDRLENSKPVSQATNAPLEKEEPFCKTLKAIVLNSDVVLMRNLKGKLKEKLKENVNCQDKKKITPLIYASGKGNVEIVEILIKNGANVNHLGWRGHTALENASSQGHDRIVKTLIENGAEVNYVAENGATPLMVAAGKGHETVVRTLIENGANVYFVSDKEPTKGATALSIARLSNQQEIVKILKAAGDEPKVASNSNEGMDSWTSEDLISQKELHDLMDLGFEALEKEDFDQALEIHNRIITKMRTSESKKVYKKEETASLAFWGRGRAYLGKEEHDRAIQDFNKSLKFDPKLNIVYFWRAFAYLARAGHPPKRKDIENAIADFNRYLKFNPEHYQSLLYRAISYSYIKEWDRAVQEFRKILKNDPHNQDVPIHLQDAIIATGNWLDFLGDFQECLKKSPNNPKCHIAIGLSYASLGDFGETEGKEIKSWKRDSKSDWRKSCFHIKKACEIDSSLCSYLDAIRRKCN